MAMKKLDRAVWNGWVVCDFSFAPVEYYEPQNGSHHVDSQYDMLRTVQVSLYDFCVYDQVGRGRNVSEMQIFSLGT